MICACYLPLDANNTSASLHREKDSLLCIMWMCIAAFLLWTRSGGCVEKANTSDLIEYTAADFYEKLQSGKMMFIYFEHKGRALTVWRK